MQWVQYLKDYDLHTLSVDQLLQMLTLALDLRMPKLHKNIVCMLIDRCTKVEPEEFNPGQDTVSRLCDKCKEDDGARRLCAYLLGTAGEFESYV